MLPILALLCGLAMLVCFTLVVVKMFQNGKTTPGIVSLVGLLCGIGMIFAFVYGWMKAKDWRITNIMIVWSIASVLYIALVAMSVPAMMEQARIQQERDNLFVPAPAAP
jgi:hypothetical protein